jgi:hypothetical protein
MAWLSHWAQGQSGQKSKFKTQGSKIEFKYNQDLTKISRLAWTSQSVKSLPGQWSEFKEGLDKTVNSVWSLPDSEFKSNLFFQVSSNTSGAEELFLRKNQALQWVQGWINLKSEFIDIQGWDQVHPLSHSEFKGGLEHTCSVCPCSKVS